MVGGDGHFGEHVAARYDESSAEMFKSSAVDPAVDVLTELAGGGRALELGIGTGRIALPLARRGIPVHGIDMSRAMVARLRAKPGAEAIGVTIGDFATTQVAGRFTVVYLVFNTIMNPDPPPHRPPVLAGDTGLRRRQSHLGRAPRRRPVTSTLDPADRAILSLEAQRWIRPGAKDAAVREQLGISPVAYYQRLNTLIDTPAALATHPTLVNRLRRLRDQRRRARSRHSLVGHH